MDEKKWEGNNEKRKLKKKQTSTNYFNKFRSIAINKLKNIQRKADRNQIILLYKMKG